MVQPIPETGSGDERRVRAAVRAWLGPGVRAELRGRLPGLSNRSYRVALSGAGPVPHGDVVVRLPGAHAHAEVDRVREQRAAASAAGAGLAPRLHHADAARGILVTEWLEGARPLTGEDLRRPAILTRVARALARLHALPVTFGGTLDPPAVLDAYLEQARERGVATDPHAAALLARARAVAARLAPSAPAPCHGDLTPGNVLLDAGGEVWLVDFEYAADADPRWDLAELAASRALDLDASRALLAAYGEATGAAPGAGAALDDHLAWRLVADAIAAAWALLRGERALATSRLAGCARMLAAMDGPGPSQR